jgi:hypothetical protein
MCWPPSTISFVVSAIKVPTIVIDGENGNVSAFAPLRRAASLTILGRF